MGALARAVAAVGCLLAACSASPPPDPRPNVLLVTVDSLRADWLGAYGFALDTSPHIDRLAAEGLLFERAIAASSQEVSSLASILSSRFAREHGVGLDDGEARLAGVVTLAQGFRDAGYRTGAFVSDASLRRDRGRGLESGFEHYDDELSGPERTADATTRRAVAWLSRDPDAPFFAWVHYRDPHGPYRPPAPARGRFRVRGEPGQAALPVLEDDSGYGGIPASQVVRGRSLPSEYESAYADEIHFADLWIGRLLAAVDERPGGREAAVLLTADHGESFGEGGRWFVHRESTTPEVARVPLLLRAPGLAPARVAGVAHHVDVLPTLLAVADLPARADARGISLLGTPAGGGLPERFVPCEAKRELSAYDATGFVRVLLTGPDPLWVRFRWNPGGPWTREPSGGPLAPELQRLLERIGATPTAP